MLEESLFESNAVGELLFKWLYSEELLNKGYLKNDTIPVCLTEDQGSIVKSHCGLHFI